MNNDQNRMLVPPITREIAEQKRRKAEDGWNSPNPQKVALAKTLDSQWRDRAQFATGRESIIKFLTRRWQREVDHRLTKELWAFDTDRIGIRFACEWRDDSGNWYRSYGNEN